MFGAGPLIGLDRFSPQNGPDLSQYANSLIPVSAILALIKGIFFPSLLPGNVGGWSPFSFITGTGISEFSQKLKELFSS
jgi:hypothetical protein